MSATISLTIRFNLDTGKFLFTDTSNYAAQVSPDLGVKGCLRITGPSGLVYANPDFATPVSATADITTAGGLVNSAINIPIDANGIVQHGAYTIEYNVYITSGTDAGQTLTMTALFFTYCFDKPVVSISQSTDCINAIFTSVDSTNYVVDGVTPSVSLTHKVVEVANPSRTNISNSNNSNTVTYPNLYNGDYKTTITSIVTHSFSAYSVVVTITGGSTYKVACVDQCDLYCGMKSLENSYQNNVSTGDIRAAENDKSKMAILSSYITLYGLAVDCGKTSEATNYLTKIKTIGNFKDSCCTSTGQVIPASSSSSLNLSTTEDGIVASPIQTQAGATLLYAMYNRIDTVTSNGDSCVMPSAKIGMTMTIANFDTSNSVHLYPAVGDQFITSSSTVPVNNNVTLGLQSSTQYVCFKNGQWSEIMTSSI